MTMSYCGLIRKKKEINHEEQKRILVDVLLLWGKLVIYGENPQ